MACGGLGQVLVKRGWSRWCQAGLVSISSISLVGPGVSAEAGFVSRREAGTAACVHIQYIHTAHNTAQHGCERCAQPSLWVAPSAPYLAGREGRGHGEGTPGRRLHGIYMRTWHTITHDIA